MACDVCNGSSAGYTTYFIGDNRAPGVSVIPSDNHFITSAQFAIIDGSGATVASGSCNASVTPGPGDAVGGPYTSPPTSVVRASVPYAWSAVARFIVRYKVLWDDTVLDNSISQEILVLPLPI